MKQQKVLSVRYASVAQKNLNYNFDKWLQKRRLCALYFSII